MKKKTLWMLMSLLVFAGLMFWFTRCIAPIKNEPFNAKIWLLPNGEYLKYYEIWDGTANFTANLSQMVILNKKDGRVLKYSVGIGGSYKQLELHKTADKYFWITGKLGGAKKVSTIAALNLEDGTSILADKMEWNKKDLTDAEQKILMAINSSSGSLVPLVSGEVKP